LDNPEGMIDFIKGQSLWILIAVVIFAGLYILTMRLMKPAQK
jgi:hypothetical protein